MTKRASTYFWLSVTVVGLAAVLRLGGLAQTPPGLHVDEAYHLLRAQDLVLGRDFFVYIPGNQGNEPMQAYLSAVALVILGPVSWAGRFVSAVAGLLTVALTVRVGRELFPRRGVGVLAGAVAAMLGWHITLSRFGTQPALAALAAAGVMAALWSGWRSRRWGAFALAGFCLAFGLWSYVAFRVFPIVPLLLGGLLWLRAGSGRRAVGWGGVLAGGLALGLYAPLAIYFWQHPHLFSYRFNQVTLATLGAGSPQWLWNNLLAVLGGLFVWGDDNWRFNLPHLPALDGVQAVFFVVGVLICLWRWRRNEAVALLLWLAVSLATSVITEYPPQFGRMLMGVPAVAVLIALGLEKLWEWRRPGRGLARGLVGAALLFSLGATGQRYFVAWGQNSNLFIAYDVGFYWLAGQLRAEAPGTALYESPVARDYATLEYTLGPEAFTRFKSFQGPQCVVLPATTAVTTTYAVIVPEDPATLPVLQTAFPAGQVVAQNIWIGEPYAVLYRIPPAQTAQLTIPTLRPADYSGLVALRGYALAATEFQPGQPVVLTVFSQVEQATRAAYKMFVHVIGPPQPDGNILYGQFDAEPCHNTFPTWQWAPGEVVVEVVTFTLPDTIPAGEYWLQVGWYDTGTLARVPATDAAGQALGDSVRLEQIRVTVP